MTYQDYIEFPTEKHGHMHDITVAVGKIVETSGIERGTAHVFNQGSTAVVSTIEYAHEETWHDGNGHSHLQASMLGPEITVPIVEGALFLGTWQQIFHLECDNKPRQRVVLVTVIGE